MPRLDVLWYEIDARTKDFDENIVGAKKKLQEFTDYAATHPGVVLGALGVALAAVAYEAAKMAGEIDQSMRQLRATMPAAASAIGGLRKEIEDLSAATPKTQKELAETAVEIAKLGVSTPEEIGQRLKAIAEISEATTIDLKTIADGMNVVGDAFTLSGQKAIDATKEIFAITQGRVPLEEVFRALERGGSVLSSLSVRATDAAQAMATLRDAGVMPRKVGTALVSMLEFGQTALQQLPGAESPERRAELQKYLDIMTRTNIATNGLIPVVKQLSEAFGNQEANLRHLGLSADAVNAVLKIHAKTVEDNRTEAEKLEDAEKKVAAAAYENSNSMSALNEKIHNQLNNTMIEFGNKTLPVVISAMKSLLDILNPASRAASDLADAMTRVAAGRPDFGGTAAGKDVSRLFGYDISPLFDPNNPNIGRSAPQGDVETLARGVATKGAEAVFEGKSAAQVASIIKVVKAYSDQNDEIREATQLMDAYLIKVTATTQRTEDQTAADQRATIQHAAQDDAIRKANLTRDEHLRILKETRTLLDGLANSLRQELAAETPSPVDNELAKIAEFETKIKEIRDKRGTVPQSMLDDLEKVRAHVEVIRREVALAAMDKINQIVDEATVTQVDNLSHALDQLVRELQKVPGVTQQQIDAVVRMKEAYIDAQRAIDATHGRFTYASELGGTYVPRADIERMDVGAQNQGMQNMRTLLDQREALVEEQNKLTRGSTAEAAVRARIAEIDSKIAAVQQTNVQLLTEIDDIEKKRVEHLQQTLSLIQSTVSGATQLLQAFGLMDEATAKILSNIAQVAQGIPALSAAIHAFHEGSGGILGVIGTAMPIIGGIASIASGLFGKSAADIERERLTKENTNAIRELTKGVGDLARINVTGTQYQAVSGFLADPRLRNLPPALLGQDAVNRAIGAILDSLNMTSEQLKQFAHQFGIAVGTGTGGKITADDLEKLREAMAKAEITKFADSFTGQMQEMDAAIQLFDLTKPIDQFNQMKKALDGIAGGGGILARTLSNFDLTTSEGVKKAQQAIQDLFTAMQAGTLNAADLGGLTPQDFLEALKRVSDILKAQGAAPGLAGTGGFNVDRTITEVSASRLAALLTTNNMFAEMTATNTAAIAALLSGGNVPTIRAPNMSSASISQTSALGGGGVVIQQLTVQVSMGSTTDTDTAQRVGQRIAQSTIDALDRELASRMKWNLRGRGKTSLR